MPQATEPVFNNLEVLKVATSAAILNQSSGYSCGKYQKKFDNLRREPTIGWLIIEEKDAAFQPFQSEKIAASLIEPSSICSAAL